MKHTNNAKPNKTEIYFDGLVLFSSEEIGPLNDKALGLIDDYADRIKLGVKNIEAIVDVVGANNRAIHYFSCCNEPLSKALKTANVLLGKQLDYEIVHKNRALSRISEAIGARVEATLR